MKATVAKWGNSVGIRIPRGVLEDAGIAEGSEVDIRVEAGRIVLEPVHAPTLDQLIDGITPANRHGEELGGEPTGRETW